MRIAILYEDKRIYVEFESDKFKELLNKYFNKFKSLDEALDQIVKDLKDLAQRK